MTKAGTRPAKKDKVATPPPKKIAAAALGPSLGKAAKATEGKLIPQAATSSVAIPLPEWMEKNCGDCEFQLGGVCRFAPPTWRPPRAEQPGHEPSEFAYPSVVHEKFGTFLQACSSYKLRST